MTTVLRRACWVLLALLLVVGVWTAVVLVSVRGELQAARADLEAATEADEVLDVRALVGAAEQRLADAHARLRQPGPAVAGVLPVVGRTVDAVRETTGATLAVVTGGHELLEQLPSSLVEGGRVDLAAVRRLSLAADEAAARSRGPVAELADADLALVPGPVADGVREARRRLADAPDTFARTSAALAGVRGVLGADRPRSLLVMLQNNAELRGTGGVVTVFASATARDGRLEIGSFRDVEDVADTSDEVTTVPAPEDYEALWGPFLANSTLWLNVNMTPDVPTASSVLADVAVASGLPRPDGVVWLDVPAISALLGATGPVELPDGTRLTEDNAVEVLLSDAYENAVDTREGQAQRRAVLRAAADAVLGQLLSPGGLDGSVSQLGTALADAAAGRHLALWSGDEQVQRALVAGDLAGRVAADDGDLSAVALQNFGGGNRQGNKLDFYARRQVTVRVAVSADEAVVEQEIAVRNTAPVQGLPQYVAGEVEPGVSRNYLALALPAGARDVRLTRGGQPVGGAVQPSGDHAVVTDGAVLPPGATAEWSLRYRLPVEDGRYSLRLVPQPLAVDAGLHVEVRAAGDVQLRGRDVTDDAVVLSGPYTAERLVTVEVVRPGLVRRAADAVRRFWNQPVELP